MRGVHWLPDGEDASARTKHGRVVLNGVAHGEEGGACQEHASTPVHGRVTENVAVSHAESALPRSVHSTSAHPCMVAAELAVAEVVIAEITIASAQHHCTAVRRVAAVEEGDEAEGEGGEGSGRIHRGSIYILHPSLIHRHGARKVVKDRSLGITEHDG